MSPQSKAHIRASDKYNKKTYDQIKLLLKKIARKIKSEKKHARK